MSPRERWTLAVAVLGSGIVFLDSTVVNVAMARIGSDLPAVAVGVLEGQSYVYHAYLVALSSLLILAGALSDYYGRRRTFAIGLAAFGATSALCGLAPNLEALVLFRVLQGAAGALLVPGSLPLITSTFQGEQRGRAFGIWAGASSGTTIFGPLVGGLLVDLVSWRVVFLVNVPIVLLALWATLRYVAESRDEQAQPRFDWLGALVAALAVGGLSFGAIYGQQRDWRDPLAFAALALGLAAALAFVPLMRASPAPLVPLHLFRSRNFAVTNLSTLLIYGSLYVTFYFVPLFLQGTLGYTAAATGLAMTPSSLFLVLLSTRFGTLAGRHGPRRFMAAGPAIMALALLWLARVPPDGAAWGLRPDQPNTLLPPVGYLLDILPPLVLYGVGLAVMVAPLTTALMGSVPERHSGLASAINNAISRVGPPLAGALIFVAITASFYAAFAARAPGADPSSAELRRQVAPLNRPADSVPPAWLDAWRLASRDAFQMAMLLSAGLLLAGAAVNAIGIRDPLPAHAGGAAPASPDPHPAPTA